MSATSCRRWQDRVDDEGHGRPRHGQSQPADRLSRVCRYLCQGRDRLTLCERGGTVDRGSERRVGGESQGPDLLDAVRLIEHASVEREKAFDCLLRRLLAVKRCGVEERRSSGAGDGPPIANG